MNKVLEIARAEIGYLEKASPMNLDSKTGNAGAGNYTKYWRDLYPSYQGQPWCDCFVGWCFLQAYGVTNAKKLLAGEAEGPYDSSLLTEADVLEVQQVTEGNTGGYRFPCRANEALREAYADVPETVVFDVTALTENP